MFREYADKYLKLGISVFPAMSNKVPAIPSWAPYQTRTATPEEIEAWSEDLGENINIALVCGKLSNLTVVDCDSEEAAEKVKSLLPDQIEVPIVFTPKKGCRHYYFQFTPGLLNRARYQAGIDVRTEGGYVLAPPSQTKKTPDGKCVDGEYIWHKEYQLGKICPPPMPAELRDYLLSGLKGEGQVRCGEESKDRSQILVEGTRDQDLFHLALQFFKDGRPVEEIQRNILAAAAICKPPHPEKEALAKIKSAEKFYNEKCRNRAKNDEDASEEPEFIWIRASEVQTKKIRWLWPGIIPLNMSSTIVGDPGVGKTFVAVDIAARISTGRAFPIYWKEGHFETKPRPKNVIYITSEGSPSYILVPRLVAASADLARIEIYQGIYTSAGGFAILDITKHLPFLQKKVLENPGLYGALITDPLVSHLPGKSNMIDSIQMRQAVDHFSRFTEATGCASITIQHANKDEKKKAAYRTSGSSQLTAGFDISWFVTLDPDNDQNRRLLVPQKVRMTAGTGSLPFLLTELPVKTDDGETSTIGKIEWDREPIEVDVNQAVSPGYVAATTTDRAKSWDFLKEQLASGPKFVSFLKARAEKENISPYLLYQARKDLGIRKAGGGGFGGAAYWFMAGDTRPPSGEEES